MNRPLPPSVPRALVLALASAFAFQAHANSGRVEFVAGGATLRNAQGDRPLARGTELRTGDTVITNNNGRAQVRFTDGAFVSLQPETEFSVEQYQFNGQTDGSERGLFALVKGTMRTVTGLVGRVNRDRYAVRTPNATIGIRGTGGVISFGPNGTVVQGTSGDWVIGNDGGTVFVPAGRTGTVTGTSKDAPKESGGGTGGDTTQTSSTGSKDPSTSPSENRTSTGQSEVVPSTKQGAVGYALIGGNATFTLGNTAAVTTNSSTGSVIEYVTNGSGQLTDYKSTNTNNAGQVTTVAFSGTHAEGGTSGAIGWGRWTNGTLTNTFTYSGGSSVNSFTVGSNGGLHYFYGSPATAMPTSGTFSYNMVGATNPTFKSEAFAPGSVTSATLNGTFTPTGGTVGISMALTANSTNYTLSASTTFTGSTFTSTGFNTTGGSCSSGCSTTVNGAFAGAGASHAGVGYAITLPSNVLGGVVAFQKQ